MQYLIKQVRFQNQIIEKLSAVIHSEYYHELVILTKLEPSICRKPWADPETVFPSSPSDLSLNTQHYQSTFNNRSIRRKFDLFSLKADGKLLPKQLNRWLYVETARSATEE